MGNPEETTGFRAPGLEHVPPPGGETDRPLSLVWVSEDLLTRTREVWSKAYGRPVEPEEAIEILMNVKRLAEALMKTRKGGKLQ